MKQVAALVQILVCLMIMLNGVLLVMTRVEYWPSILLIILPVIQCMVVDRKRWYELPSWAANVIGFGIGAYAIFYFLNNTAEKHLAIISDLVTYLILTLLMQVKSPRLYWQIAILSVLQAVVASVFSLNLQQGTIFLFYIFVVLACLSSIVLNRDQLMAAGRLDELQNLIRDLRSIQFSRSDGAMRTIPAVQTLNPFAFRCLMLSIGMVAVLSVCSGMAIYVSMPNEAKMAGLGTLRLKRTGITWQIKTLEPSGILEQSDTEALRLKIIDPVTEKPIQLMDDIYLRGTCLEVLGQDETNWQPIRFNSRSITTVTIASPPGRVYTQEIVITSTEDPMLFAAMPVAPSASPAKDVAFDIYSETLFRRSDTGLISRTPFRYELGLYGVTNQRIATSSPFLNFQARSFDRPLNEDLEGRYEQLVKIDRRKFPTLISKAKAIESEVGNPYRNRRQVAQAVANYLALSGEFTYTTDFTTIKRDTSLDPVEDFVANYKTGHCELYASALAIMLRSLDIPARVVVGYRTGRFNEVASYYEVEELHAHSWVEAYLAPNHCSREMLQRGEASEGGAWLRLDPTPSSTSLETRDNSLIGQANDALGYAQSLWDDYILGLKPTEQEATSTMWDRFSKWQSLFDLSRLSGLIQDFLVRLTAIQRAIIGVLIFLAVAWWQWLTRRSRSKRRKYSGPRAKQKGWRRWLDLVGGGSGGGTWDVQHWADSLMDRLESVVTKFGFEKRKPSQTPQEYVDIIAKRTHQDGQEQLPQQLKAFATQFYWLKYGSKDTKASSKGDSTAASKSIIKEIESVIATVQSSLQTWKDATSTKSN